MWLMAYGLPASEIAAREANSLQDRLPFHGNPQGFRSDGQSVQRPPSSRGDFAANDPHVPPV